MSVTVTIPDELVEALQWTVAHLERLDPTNPTLNQARAALHRSTSTD